ncbi:MAG: cytochrome c [Alphaproteobacteria bacterium]|nr:cytochrome c [Alphaproteobacteria bacterium]
MSADDRLVRGEYLVTGIAGCGNCHTPKGPDGEIEGMALAGGFAFPEESFTSYAANITPDKRTGIGGWTADQIVTSIRDGVRPDGSLIGPPMPIEFYRGISDSDAHAMAAYLMSVPAIENRVRTSQYDFPLPDSYGPPVVRVPDVLRDKPAAYGAYLAGPVGHCMECHTPWDEQNRLMLDTHAGAGGRDFHGPWGVSVSADIRADTDLRVAGAWSDAEIVAAITTGTRPDGAQMPPPMGYGYYARMSDEDLAAIVAFLRTLSPVAGSPGAKTSSK